MALLVMRWYILIVVVDGSVDGSALVSSIDTETQLYVVISCVVGVVVIVVVVVVIVLLLHRRKQSRSKKASIDSEVTGVSNPNISKLSTLININLLSIGAF